MAFILILWKGAVRNRSATGHDQQRSGATALFDSGVCMANSTLSMRYIITRPDSQVGFVDARFEKKGKDGINAEDDLGVNIDTNTHKFNH
jgi:hypothetical protein